MVEFFNVSPELISQMGQSTGGAKYTPVAPGLLETLKFKKELEYKDKEIAMKEKDYDLRRATLERGIFESDRNYKAGRADAKAMQEDRDRTYERLVEEAKQRVYQWEQGYKLQQRQAEIAEQVEARAAGAEQRERASDDAINAALAELPEDIEVSPATRAYLTTMAMLRRKDVIDPEVILDQQKQWLDYVEQEKENEDDSTPGEKFAETYLTAIAKVNMGQQDSAISLIQKDYDKKITSAKRLDAKNPINSGILLEFEDNTSELITIKDAAMADSASNQSLYNLGLAFDRGERIKLHHQLSQETKEVLANDDFERNLDRKGREIYTSPLVPMQLAEATALYNSYFDEPTRDAIESSVDPTYKNLVITEVYKRSLVDVNNGGGFIQDYYKNRVDEFKALIDNNLDPDLLSTIGWGSGKVVRQGAGLPGGTPAGVEFNRTNLPGTRDAESSSKEEPLEVTWDNFIVALNRAQQEAFNQNVKSTSARYSSVVENYLKLNYPELYKEFKDKVSF